MGRADLEEALAACWNVEDLAVYADLLLADDDPRGELIALDLQQSDADDWQIRRFAALAKWLGSDLARRSYNLIKHGFVHELDDGKRLGSLAPALLDSPAGPYIRKFTTRGPQTKVRATMQRVAAKPRPFLTVLEISARGGTSGDLVISEQLGGKLIAATPRLHELEVRGHRVIGTLAHPALRRLHLSNHDSVVDVVRPRVDEDGFLRVTCDAATGQYAGMVPREELEAALSAIDGAPSYDRLYAKHADVFGETLPALIARLEQSSLVQLQSGRPVLSPYGREVHAGARPMPTVRRTLERPLVPIPHNRHGNNVWLETKKQIAFIANIQTLSTLACQWLERLPLTLRIRRVVEELLDVLYTLRHHGRTHAQESVSANLELLLRQLCALEAAGIDPRREGETSIWGGGWPDVRDGAYREILRTVAVRMTFAVR